ncbi:MAG TPA: TetR/AcrR family transcriptional regulator [Candidatus Dormibacteraeota bacterium]|nr:TetR/AcrR family transcriptional regulator [Candidatus Dormibacteraeota bacterium]
MSDASGAAVTAESAERRVRRRQSRRELIVLAAVEVFREMGLEKATLEAVGERVGLSKASLYYYVRSKEELLGHVVVHVVQAQAEALARVASAGGPEERLRAFCESHLRIICTDPVGQVSARVALSGIKDDVVRRPLHEYMSRLEAILRDGVAAGVFRDMDLRIAQHSIIATLNAVPLWFSPEGRLTLDEVAAQVTGLLVDGTLARP